MPSAQEDPVFCHTDGSSSASMLSKKRRRGEWDVYSPGTPLRASTTTTTAAAAANAAGFAQNQDNLVAILLHGNDAGRAYGPEADLDRSRRCLATAAATNTHTTSLHPQIMSIGRHKRLRLDDGGDTDSSSNSCPGDPDGAARKLSPSGAVTSASLLQPCHICQRRPRRKCDLASLADCEGCGRRTCFVCLRECPGWAEGGRDGCNPEAEWPPEEQQQQEEERKDQNEEQRQHQHHQHHQQHQHRQQRPQRAQQPVHGPDDETDIQLGASDASTRRLPPWSAENRGHRRMVCSRCCVEQGQDGDVVCFGCMPFVVG